MFLRSFTGSASWLKLTVAAVSGKINFTSALFPIWKFCWIDRGWLESWQRPTGEMDISVDTTPKRDERDAFVGSNQMKDTFVSWKDIFVGSQWKSWTLTRTNAPPSFCLHSFFSSKVSSDEDEDCPTDQKIKGRWQWTWGWSRRRSVSANLGAVDASRPWITQLYLHSVLCYVEQWTDANVCAMEIFVWKSVNLNWWPGVCEVAREREGQSEPKIHSISDRSRAQRKSASPIHIEWVDIVSLPKVTGLIVSDWYDGDHVYAR